VGVGRPARVYLSLAPTDGEQLVATWRTQGRLLPGTDAASAASTLASTNPGDGVSPPRPSAWHSSTRVALS